MLSNHYIFSRQFIIPAIIMILAAYYIQFLLPLEGDVGYLMEMSERVLKGGKYGNEIFETNPPMILYLYIPPVLFAKLFFVSNVLAVRAYILLIATLSIFGSIAILNKIIKPNDYLVTRVIFYILFFILIFLPSHEFAQRDHLVLIFILPYLFSSVLALQNKVRLSLWVTFLIGTIAGIGFALKPFFLVTPCLIELYFIICTRKFWGWVRVESIMILMVLIVYLISIFMFQPNYIKVIVPLLPIYFQGFHASLLDTVINVSNVFCLMGLAIFCVYVKKDDYRLLNIIIVLALIGMMLAYMIARSPWFYHVIPAWGLTCLLMGSYLGQNISACCKSNKLRKVDCFVIILIATFLYYIPINIYYTNITHAIHRKNRESNLALASFIRSLPGRHKLYCFSSEGTVCFPLVYNTDSLYGAGDPFFWWLIGLLKLENYPEGKTVPLKLLKQHNFLIERFAKDLTIYQPDIIIIRKKEDALSAIPKFNYIDYFSKNDRFNEAWKNYYFLKSIEDYNLYRRKV